MSKHLSLSERSIIESMLNKDFTFAQIAKKLGRTGSTISREVHKRRIFTGKFDNYTHNDCIYFFSCLKNTVCPKHPTHGCFTRCKLCSEADCIKLCDRYVSCNCELLNNPPYVCTGCPKQKSCKKEHAYYTATKAHADYLSELKKLFKPEFLNRVDDIVVFSKLTHDEIKQIASNMLATLSERLSAMDITVSFTDAAKDRLADEGFDDTYGARPLRRTIQTKIEDTISEKLLDGSLKKGDSVVCDYKDDKFEYTTASES